LLQLPCGRSTSEQIIAQRLHVGRLQIASSELQTAQNSGASPVGSHGLPQATHRGGKRRSIADEYAAFDKLADMLAPIAFVLPGLTSGLIVPRSYTNPKRQRGM